MDEWQARFYIYYYWEEIIPFFIMQIYPEIIRKFVNDICKFQHYQFLRCSYFMS